MQSNFSLEGDGYQQEIKSAITLFNQVLKNSGTDSAAPQGLPVPVLHYGHNLTELKQFLIHAIIWF